MTKVRRCPRCFQLMWVRDDDLEYLDDETIRLKCPQCHELVRLKLVVEGERAGGPKMGH